MSKNSHSRLNRRDFIKSSVLGLAALPAIKVRSLMSSMQTKKSQLAVVVTDDRKEGVRKTLELLDFYPPKGKKVLVKPNFNTSDPCPGSTHNDTLEQLIQELNERGASSITVGDRSGPEPTTEVLEKKGIPALSEKLDFNVIDFDAMPETEWVHFNPEGNHWNNGFYLAKPVVDSEYTVSTCCLKTHQYGGIFTLSLKNSVGIAPRKLMRELHSRKSDHMRHMIAELNTGYSPQLIVLDGVEAFVDGGPMTGEQKAANVFLASTDRIAVDSAGIAVLKALGSNDAIMKLKVFEHEQIRRAGELGLGIKRPDQIEFLTPDKASREYARKLESILAE